MTKNQLSRRISDLECKLSNLESKQERLISFLEIEEFETAKLVDLGFWGFGNGSSTEAVKVKEFRKIKKSKAKGVKTSKK